MNSSYPSWPKFGDEEIAAVVDVLRSGKVNYHSGDQCNEFEREYCNKVGRKYGVALANGTVALELALRALEIGPGDEVIVPGRSFIASASCVVMVGATPVFSDVDKDSQNISVDTIRPVVTDRTKAIIVVHIAGWPCDMDPINEFAAENDLMVVEDCAQAHGAKYKNRPVGSLGDVAAFSFCNDKIITTGGEGGMLLTNNETVWRKAWSFKDHGKDYDLVFNTSHPVGYRWLHRTFGTNWRMTEMQSAIGRVMLGKLDKWVEKRRKNANMLNSLFSNYDYLRLTIPEPDYYHSYYKYYVFVHADQLRASWDRNRIMTVLTENDIPCFNTYGGEMFLDEAFQANNLKPNYDLPVAKQLGDTGLQLLVPPNLDDQKLLEVCQKIEEILPR